MQDTLVSLCAAARWHEADALIDHLVSLSEEQLHAALQEKNGSPQWTSLHYAALCKPTPSTLSKLLQNGADVHARGSSGSTPLHLAAWNGCEHTAELLLAHGADMEATSNNARTPLMFAARRGDASMMHSLLQRGADVHARDARGRSALHFAAQSTQPTALRTLFAHGATDEADRDGVTAMDLAQGEARQVLQQAHEEDVRSEWSVRRTLSEVLNVHSWRQRFGGVARHVRAANGSVPPSPPPSPSGSAMASGAVGLGGGASQAVRRGELYAVVSAGVLLSILLPMARGAGGGGGGQS